MFLPKIGLELKNNGHTNFYEHCNFMKKYILPPPHMKTQTEIYLDLNCMRISFFKALKKPSSHENESY